MVDSYAIGRDFRRHSAIIWALLLRELGTRYGRNNIGFLWVIGEPLIFGGAVLAMWSAIKPPYEHGLRLIPFLATGYMSVLLMRHMIGHGMHAVSSSVGLLYHRQITILHMFVARGLLELIGVTFAFVVIVLALLPFGLLEPPRNLGLLYEGWLLLAWMSFGLAMIAGALNELYDFVDRIVAVITYILVPLSGTFYMAAWVPPHFRRILLAFPFIHGVEMVRGGYLGPFVPVYFDVAYASAWASVFTVIGLLLLNIVRTRVEVE